MKVYLDVVFLLNLFFDAIILLCVTLVLKRNVKFKRVILGSFIGSLSIFFLFFELSNFSLFILKIILCIIIIIATFGYKDIKYFLNNIIHFFIISMILGGFLYYLNINFSYENIGIVFYNKGLSVNAIFLVISSPLILYIYIKQMKKQKLNYSLYYEVELLMNNNKVINLIGFMDTANNLIDPYKNRPIVIVSDKRVFKNITDENILLIPYDTLDSHGILKCFKPKKLTIKNIGQIKKVLIGICDKDFKMNGVNCILNKLILEEK
jgi:stage II sporulation protein GA (sporulation sigma-E factor processing peptidase)